jgi:N-acetylmuramoyl-L-alanine amidase
MKARFVISILTLLLAAACANQERKVTPLFRAPAPQPIVESPSPASIEHPVQPAEPTPAVVEPKPEVKPVVVEPTEIKPAATQPLTGWVSLQDWCNQNKLSAPQITKENPTNINVAIRSDNGVFAFEPPRRNARWNGTLIGVGFPPVFTNQTVLVNAIDVNKVLQPLLLLTNESLRKKGGILVIDAGHGGTNNKGALSNDKKLVEKNLTLDWARRVQKALEGSQWQVFMTRTNDIDLSLTQRVVFAEAKKADLFISLHFNSYSKPNEAGLETYCMTPVGMASHVTRDFAYDINVTVPNNEFDVENLMLAHDLHRAMLRKTGRKDRGVRRARFMTVLKDQRRPSVLLEGGYLSNPEEAKLIATPEYRQKLAEAVAEALGVTPPTLTTLRE